MERFVNQQFDRGALKVAFLMTGLPCGGAENALKTLLSRLDRKLFTPIVMCIGPLGDVGSELLQTRSTTMYWNVKMHPIAAGINFDVFRILKDESVHLLCDSITRAQTQALSVAAKLALGIPNVSWVHHTKRVRPHFHQELISRVCLRRYDRVIAVGSSQRTWLCRAYALDPDRVSIVHNGIPLEGFVNLPTAEQAKRALGIEPHRPVIGITAQLRPEKDHQNLFAAMRLVVRRFPEALLVLVGDGLLREYLNGLARGYGLLGNVRFLGQRRDIPNIVASYDVGVLSSWVVETLPLAVLEYMAAGKPTVATDVGSVSDLVAQGETGFLVPAKAPEALAERLLAVLQNRKLALRMGATAARVVRRRFSAAAMVSGMQTVFHEVMSKHGERPSPRKSVVQVGALS
jgi:glycosyltransferase involved in cell wall biosynthesis